MPEATGSSASHGTTSELHTTYLRYLLQIEANIRFSSEGAARHALLLELKVDPYGHNLVAQQGAPHGTSIDLET